MIYSSDIVRAYVLGGVISPLELKGIIETAERFENEVVALGSRQDILFNAKNSDIKLPEDSNTIYYGTEQSKNNYENVVSSYVSLDYSRTYTRWAQESRYLNIVNSFNFKPTLKINITDPKQALVPLMTGDINFIASKTEDYWYIYLNNDSLEEQKGYYPVLVHTFNVAKLAKALEDELLNNESISIDDLFTVVSQSNNLNTINYSEPLELYDALLPYYEGLIPIKGGGYSIGIYYRKNNFGIQFLKELCELALQTDVGKLAITPWNSLSIKGIEEKHLPKWRKLLGLYGINVRHSATELNWYIDEIDKEAQKLKRYLANELDSTDIRTKGLSFTIKIRKDMEIFTSVVIEEVSGGSFIEQIKYDIYHTKGFVQNSDDLLLFEEKVSKSDLPKTLARLSKKYFTELNTQVLEEEVIEAKNGEMMTFNQCSDCLTIYDPAIGEPEQGIPVGTAFENLSDSFCCPTCGASKSNFEVAHLEFQK